MVYEKFSKLFGPPRNNNKNLDDNYKNIAASVQKVTEEVCIKIANKSLKKTKINNLCLSGGVALNCVMNGKLHDQTEFKNIHIPCSPGDSEWQ